MTVELVCIEAMILKDASRYKPTPPIRIILGDLKYTAYLRLFFHIQIIIGM